MFSSISSIIKSNVRWVLFLNCGYFDFWSDVLYTNGATTDRTETKTLANKGQCRLSLLRTDSQESLLTRVRQSVHVAHLSANVLSYPPISHCLIRCFQTGVETHQRRQEAGTLMAGRTQVIHQRHSSSASGHLPTFSRYPENIHGLPSEHKRTTRSPDLFLYLPPFHQFLSEFHEV